MKILILFLFICTNILSQEFPCNNGTFIMHRDEFHTYSSSVIEVHYDASIISKNGIIQYEMEIYSESAIYEHEKDIYYLTEIGINKDFNEPVYLLYMINESNTKVKYFVCKWHGDIICEIGNECYYHLGEFPYFKNKCKNHIFKKQ